MTVRCTRPWGDWEVLATGEGYKVKRLRVAPGERLSYQRHRHRSEYWLVVSGSALVTINGKAHELHEGGTLLVPQQALHRIQNGGAIDLVIIEIQRGSLCEESDIERVEDDYGRGCEDI